MDTDPVTVVGVFRDFIGRRSALIKALSIDLDKFYEQCDPGKDNLCLFGHPNGQWKLDTPAEDLPPELPEPTIGINFAKNGMQAKDWVYLVAMHSDAWLVSVAHFIGVRLEFDRHSRQHLFDMISNVPTVFEVVSGITTRTASNGKAKNIKSKSNSKTVSVCKKGIAKAQSDDSKVTQQNGENCDLDDEEKENEVYICGSCGENNEPDQFWIRCEICEVWFHGKCVSITAGRSKFIKHYECPSCSSPSCSSNKRARVSLSAS